MAKKTVWHTDIVVGGQGIGVKIEPSKKGCSVVRLMPDVPGKAASKAKKRFRKAMKPRGCSTTEAKRDVERAVRKTRARWNRWHKEAY